MNKNCPICGKRVTRKDKHVFTGGKRYHKECLDEESASFRLRWKDYFQRGGDE